MINPTNKFKAALKSGKHQLGIWNSIGGPNVVEHLANCGFDWVLIDTEHSPVGVNDVLPALQAVAAYPQTTAIVRPVENNTATIKRLLDFGAQTLLLPLVQSPEEAEAAVQAMHYAPQGVRGMAGLTRASRYGQIENYAQEASDELCLLVQVETKHALDQLEAIATVPGVDGVFFGPADLAASLGYPGNPNHPEVIAAIEEAIGRLKKLDIPAGILTLNPEFATRCIELGTAFTAVGVDFALLDKAARALSAKFRDMGA